MCYTTISVAYLGKEGNCEVYIMNATLDGQKELLRKQ